MCQDCNKNGSNLEVVFQPKQFGIEKYVSDRHILHQVKKHSKCGTGDFVQIVICFPPLFFDHCSQRTRIP